jgi:hypothetical protein
MGHRPDIMSEAFNRGIAHLERMLATHASETLQYQFARAKLSALLGNMPEASAALQGLLQRCHAQLPDDDFIFIYALQVSLLTYQFDQAADAVNRRFRTDNGFRVVLKKRDPSLLTVVDCWIGSEPSVAFSITDELRSYPDRLDFVIHRWLAILPIFAEYLRQGVTETGEVPINLDDHAIVPGLAFCDNRPEYFLVPDPPYLAAKGYAQVRAHYIPRMTSPGTNGGPSPCGAEARLGIQPIAASAGVPCLASGCAKSALNILISSMPASRVLPRWQTPRPRKKSATRG